MADPFYITTPIYYVTDAPHIGHLYTTLGCDIMARYHRMMGEDVRFLTGTDEHGQKIEKKAKESGETPAQLADRVVQRYLTAWKTYEISYDDFIRTTEERHKKVVQEYMKQLMATGDVYLSEYEGWYCVPDESFWTETQVVDGKCPDCGRPVEKLKEESYFFRMSKYQTALLEHIEKNPDFIIPEYRKNEVVGFIKQDLRDLSISRTTIQWGIPMPKSPEAKKDHKVYVWFDALTNYISALNPMEKDNTLYKRYWGHARHVIGKDILRFHAVYWPTFLMALKLPLPKQIVAHGWLLDGEKKIGKSLGNAVDPLALGEEVGREALRYFFFREFSFGLDGQYTKESIYRRINSDLANDYGNCINRLCNMVEKYMGKGSIDISAGLAEDSEVKKMIPEKVKAYHHALKSFGYDKALAAAWDIVGAVNKHIESSAPWTLAKSADPKDKAKLNAVLIHCLESLRIASLLALPFIPNAAQKALGFLGAKDTPTMSLAEWGKGQKTIEVTKGDPLFPRLEWKPASNT